MVPSGRRARLVGIAFKRCWVVGNCPSNVINALSKRHLAAFPFPISSLPHLPFLYSSEMVPRFRHWFHLLCTDDSWRAKKTAKLCRRIQQSIDFDEPQPANVIAHVKTEIVAMRPSKARMIQAFGKFSDNYIVSDHYRAFTKALSKVTDDVYDFHGMKVHLRSACGLNRRQMAAQIDEWLLDYPLGGSTKLFVDDVSNMDGSVQSPHLLAHLELYQKLSPHLAHHFAQTFRFKGCVRQHSMAGAVTAIRYVGKATVKSGAQDTSSGQTCRRIDGVVRCFHRLGATAIVGFAFGDDLWLIVVGAPEVELIEAEQSKYGWKTKGCYVTTVEQSDFLACSFVRTTQGLHMTPLPGRILSKLFWTWRDVPPSRIRDYRRQVAEAILPAFKGFRFMEQFLQWHISDPATTKRSRFIFDKPKQQLQAPPGMPDWLGFLQARYGLSWPIDVQFSSFRKDQVHLVYSAWANIVMQYDLEDPHMRGRCTL